ncbi:MAG TPA: prepilin peptidase [Gemmatimonadota bacterium]|nr:prepilin peptidase [Gemmatimonadota bacterium]
MDGLAIILSGLVGLAVGSFLNVVTLRWPRGESIVSPPSRCPSCETPLRWYHNVPLVSWALLRGRCATCSAPIGWQYPLVEAATAAIWAGNVAAYGLEPQAVRAIVFLTLLLAIAVTDARFYIIPDRLSLGGAVLGVALAFLPGPPTLPESVIGAVIGGGALWIVAILGTMAFKKEAMGGGDIKMMTMIGAFLGWKGALLTVFLGALAGTLVFVPLAWKSDRLVPFGLFLALGAALAFYLGDPLLGWYMGFFR